MTIILAIWKILRRVPWQFYAAFGAVFLIWQVVAWHGRAVEARVSAAYDAGVRYATDEFNTAQAAADEAQRAKLAAREAALDTSSREITNEHLASRDDIGARADALRVRAEAAAARRRAADRGDPAGLPEAAGGVDEAACHGGLSVQDQITALEQAELNTRQLIDLQRWIIGAEAIWNQKDLTNDRAGPESLGQGNLLPGAGAEAALQR